MLRDVHEISEGSTSRSISRILFLFVHEFAVGFIRDTARLTLVRQYIGLHVEAYFPIPSFL